ncbi:MAG: high-potential iron-sulfur protein [Campylobacterales bacterium]|nr:high-potential iron-sulfur protein [Campylobacterales bacterium]
MQKSRRSFFRYMSILGLSSFCSIPLYAKTSKDIVKYQTHPNEGKSCKKCLHFVPATNECRIVEGNIDPNGWCTAFFQNPNYNEGNITQKTT